LNVKTGRTNQEHRNSFIQMEENNHSGELKSQEVDEMKQIHTKKPLDHVSERSTLCG